MHEDRAATLSIAGNRYVAIIADGMGGARAGDIASDAALTAFVRAVRARNEGDEGAILHAAFAAADQAIRDASTPERLGMGSTLVAGIAHQNDVWIGNIGDSRAVLVTSDEVIPLSREHSVVGEALRRGEITAAEALRHPERHVISRAIGEGDSRPDVKFHSVQDHDAGKDAVLLLGSDGLFNFIGDTEILEIIETARTAHDVVERVVRRAVENGSDDNVSAAAIVIDCRQRRRTLRLLAATFVALLAFGGVAYVNRHAIAANAAPLFARAHTALSSRVWIAGAPQQSIRVRLSADRHPRLRAGMTGTLCSTPQDCFAEWEVIAADASSVTLEIHPAQSAKAHSKS